MGGESNLSCYLLLYLYFKECGEREQSTAEPVWSHGQHIQIEIRIQMEGVWTCTHVLHLYSHAPVTGKVTGQFPRLPRSHSIPLGYFGVALKHVCCRRTFPYSFILSCFSFYICLTHLIVPNTYYYCILVFFMISSLHYLSADWAQ